MSTYTLKYKFENYQLHDQKLQEVENGSSSVVETTLFVVVSNIV